MTSLVVCIYLSVQGKTYTFYTAAKFPKMKLIKLPKYAMHCGINWIYATSSSSCARFPLVSQRTGWRDEVLLSQKNGSYVDIAVGCCRRWIMYTVWRFQIFANVYNRSVLNRYWVLLIEFRFICNHAAEYWMELDTRSHCSRIIAIILTFIHNVHVR